MASAYAGFEVTGIADTILNGRLLMQGSWLAWDDIQNLQMRDTDQVGDKPTLTTISGSTIKTRCFNGGSSSNMMYGNVEMPHDMYFGTGAVISPHIHWMGSTTATDTGIRYIDYTIRKVGTIYSTTTTMSGVFYNITGRQARIDEIDGDLPATGLSLGDTISFRVYRTPTGEDTYDGLMCLSQFGFHYQRNTMWSRQEYVK